MNRTAGVFVAFEGIDGSGKTTIVDLVARNLRSNGIATRTTARTDPYGPEPYRDLIDSVRHLFARADDLAVPFHLLGLAAAAQHVAILESQARAAVAAGEVVLAESWWSKTWTRLVVDAERCLGHSEQQSQQFAAWLRALFAYPPIESQHHLTVLVDTRQADRVTWYRAGEARQEFYDWSGNVSADPDGFGEYTERAQRILRECGNDAGWHVVGNLHGGQLDDVTDTIVSLIVAMRKQNAREVDTGLPDDLRRHRAAAAGEVTRSVGAVPAMALPHTRTRGADGTFSTAT